ncbi:MAG: PH domain-containing protein [Anaerolineales bacterium]
MGFLGGLLGNASEIDAKALHKELAPLLIDNERIERAFRIIRDLFVFTDKRLILVDKQGLTGKKTAYHSIPYQSIRHFAVETAGRFDMDAEMRIWIADIPMPFEYEFKKGTDIIGVQKSLAQYVLQ